MTLPTIFPLSEDEAAHREVAAGEVEEFAQMAAAGTSPVETAEIYAQMGWDAGALSALQTQISHDIDAQARARCYRLAGEIRERLGEFEAAARCYEAAVAVGLPDPAGRYFAHNNLGYCLNRLGRHAEAEACCRRAIEIDAARFNAHKNLGIALEGTGRPGEAAVAYRIAARAQPRDDRALRRLRVLLVNHPDVVRDQPDLVDEVEALRKSSPNRRSESGPVGNGPNEEDVRRLLLDIRVAEEVAAGELQVFGLFWDRPGELDYSTLDEALAGGSFRGHGDP